MKKKLATYHISTVLNGCGDGRADFYVASRGVTRKMIQLAKESAASAFVHLGAVGATWENIHIVCIVKLNG